MIVPAPIMTRVEETSSGEGPTAIDLFSGGGGLTAGLKEAGFRVIGAIDSDAVSADTYRQNHPEVRLWNEDIRSLDVAEIYSALGLEHGQLSLLAGCPPCQGFSTLRTLNGSKTVSDPRNELLNDLLRFIDGLRPLAVMMENVPDLVNDERLKVFCSAVSAIGYSVRYKVQNAADFGVPQRRKRMILIGTRVGRIKFARRRRKGPTVRDVIGDLPRAGASGDDLHDVPEARSERVRQLIRRIPRDGGSRADLPEGDQLECHRNFDGFNDIYGRMAWDKVAPTITSGCFNPSKGRFLHPKEDRAITLREAAILQGLPPEYSISLRRGKVAAAAVIGNAFPPELARSHAAMLRKYALRPGS